METYADTIRQLNLDQLILLMDLETELATMRIEMLYAGYPLGKYNRRAGLLWIPGGRR